MKTIAIIPARMQATRFPGKPLKPILGLPMIEHVRRRVLLCEDLDDVIVATCDESIKDVVESSGGKAVMTADTYERCTDRIAEAALSFKSDIVINVQGDEPLIMPEMLSAMINVMKSERNIECVNMVTPIIDDVEFNDPNAPKVVTDLKNKILYISREPIPSKKKTNKYDYRKLKQLGLIAFRYDFLQKFTKLEQTPLEKIESVDMMRAIEHGFFVLALESNNKMIGVDVPEDINKVEVILKEDKLLSRYLS